MRYGVILVNRHGHRISWLTTNDRDLAEAEQLTMITRCQHYRNGIRTEVWDLQHVRRIA